jgi:DNA-binding response OmpR family regulator
MVPLMSGWELLRMVRTGRRSSEIPVVVITAVGRDRPTGIQAVLRKSFPVEQLLEVVSRFADGAGEPNGPSVSTDGHDTSLSSLIGPASTGTLALLTTTPATP